MEEVGTDNVLALPNPEAWRDPCPARGVTSRRVAVEAAQRPEPVKHELYAPASPTCPLAYYGPGRVSATPLHISGCWPALRRTLSCPSRFLMAVAYSSSSALPGVEGDDG